MSRSVTVLVTGVCVVLLANRVQLERAWPTVHWDHWIRKHGDLKDREVVIPEVRSRSGGLTGASSVPGTCPGMLWPRRVRLERESTRLD